MRVLIVDDSEDARMILTKTLESAGYKVQDAANGVAALLKAKESPPDMIISDILMPEMDGYKLCREVKQSKQLRKIPFIIYTSTYTTPKDENFAKALGASCFIIKPLEPPKFLEIINAVAHDLKEHKLHVPRMPLEDDDELSKIHRELVSKKLDDKVKDLDATKGALREKDHQLHAAKEKYQKLVESANDEIIVPDND